MYILKMFSGDERSNRKYVYVCKEGNDYYLTGKPHEMPIEDIGKAIEFISSYDVFIVERIVK